MVAGLRQSTRAHGSRWPRLIAAVFAVVLTSALGGGRPAWAAGSASYFTALAGSSLTETRDGAVAAALPSGGS